MFDFEFKLKNGKTGWVSEVISPLVDEYPVGSSMTVPSGVVFHLNDGSSRTVLFDKENTCCVISNERTTEKVRLDFGDFLSEMNMADRVLDSLDDIQEPNLAALLQEKQQLEKELLQVNEAIQKAEKRVAHLADLKKSNPSKGGRKL